MLFTCAPVFFGLNAFIARNDFQLQRCTSVGAFQFLIVVDNRFDVPHFSGDCVKAIGEESHDVRDSCTERPPT